ncbi:hypothetical protein MJO28_000572, partial [Puccinia striiformis f. sp. tritici]
HEFSGSVCSKVWAMGDVYLKASGHTWTGGQGSGSIKYAKDKDQEFFGALINMIEALEKIEKLMAKEERKKKKHCMARVKTKSSKINNAIIMEQVLWGEECSNHSFHSPYITPPLSIITHPIKIKNCILTNGVIIRDCVELTDCEAKSGAVIEAVNSPSKKKNKKGHAIGREDAVKGLGSTIQVTY